MTEIIDSLRAADATVANAQALLKDPNNLQEAGNILLGLLNKASKTEDFAYEKVGLTTKAGVATISFGVAVGVLKGE